MTRDQSYKKDLIQSRQKFFNRQIESQIPEWQIKEYHHPLIITEWGRVTVQWWSHKIRGLHNNDFIMAAKTDEIVG